MSPALSVALPFYNEAAGAAAVVTGLSAHLAEATVDYQLVLVDNGSTDGTGAALRALAAAEPRLTVVTVPANRGYGRGIRAGLDAATGDIIGYLDGDGQIAPADLLRTYRVLQAGGGDFAKARRLTRGDSWSRRLVSWTFNLCFRWLFHVEALDVNAKPKLFRREWREPLALAADDWFIDAELMLKAARLGMRTVIVDVHFHPRPAGASHVRPAAIAEFVANLARYRCGGLRAWEETRRCKR